MHAGSRSAAPRTCFLVVALAMIPPPMALEVNSGALAQVTPSPLNPLRPASSLAAPPPAGEPPSRPTSAPAPIAAPPPENGPRRTRSPAQLANDARMRACGREWRANKERLISEGKTWRAFSAECRAKLKASGQ